MATDDGWDWPFLLYAATVMLHMAETNFWIITPCKLQSLIGVYIKVHEVSEPNGASTSAQCIDQVL
jgi:hypothetical protein